MCYITILLFASPKARGLKYGHIAKIKLINGAEDNANGKNAAQRNNKKRKAGTHALITCT